MLQSAMDRIYSLSELSFAIKSSLECGFGDVRVKGEIVQPKQHSSGHWYFSIKEGDYVLDCVAWRTVRLSFKPSDGAEVMCRGKISCYPGRSKYQLLVTEMGYHGIGALMKMIEQLKNKLKDEGLFDRESKPPLPAFPKRIGIATSSTGAVIHDMLHRLRDRYPCSVILHPITVQGEKTAPEAIEAINYFNQIKVDLIILARGGGSFEDLLGFNDEKLVRAVAASKVPIITAIGHETDTTLVDFASTLRAPTPTAAIELATPNKKFLFKNVFDYRDSIHLAILRMLEHKREICSKMTNIDIGSVLEFASQKSYYIFSAFEQAAYRYLESQKSRICVLINKPDLDKYAKQLLQFKAIMNYCAMGLIGAASTKSKALKDLLKSMSYQNTLKRGFCRAFNNSGNIDSCKQAVKAGIFTIEFHDGLINTRIQN